MPLTILSDNEISTLLHALTSADVEALQHNLAEALHDYSTGTQEIGTCAQNQPLRTVIPNAGGKTLFMPARTNESIGIKVVSVATSKSNTDSSLPDKPDAKASTRPIGTLTLLSPTGAPHAFLAAETLTAFRTALASTLLLTKRTRLHTLLVFGAGAQAYWHIRLALLLRGSDIHHVRIVNRTYATAEPLLQSIYTSPEWSSLRTANAKLDFSVLSRAHGEYERLLKEYVRDADAIACCTPSTEPLFPASYLTAPEGRRKGRYLSLVGSYMPHMVEVHPDVLRAAAGSSVADSGGGSGGGWLGAQRDARSGGAVVVDTLEGCLKEAGEVMQADLEATQLVEVGELIMIKRAERREVEMGGGAADSGLKGWLAEGNVVYKSVGLGVMDVCVGLDVVRLAGEKGVGTRIEEF